MNEEAELPDWMTCGTTVLCLKDPAKSNAADNFRPISCLSLLWKLMTGIISESIYGFLDRNGILPNERKGCKRQFRGTRDQLLIDKLVLKDCMKRHTNLTMGWVDYRKVYDVVLHSWIEECLKMFGITRNVEHFICNSMKKWKTELTACGESLGLVKIRRGIFQGDSLSPLLFVFCVVPLSFILRKARVGYEFKDQKYMDDLKLYGKNETQIDSLLKTVQLFSNDTGVEFGIKKCDVLILKRGTIVQCNGIVLPSGKVMKVIEQDGYLLICTLSSYSLRKTFLSP